MIRSCREQNKGHLVLASRGFTLVEVLTVSTIFLMLSAAVVNVYLVSLQMWREGSVQLSLQRKLAGAMCRMVQGERGGTESRQHGLREARSVNIEDPQEIAFTSDVDDTTRRFYLNGNELLYDPGGCKPTVPIYDPSRSEDSHVTSTYRTNVRFTQAADGTIEVHLIGEQRVRDRWIHAALTTKVTPRNAY